jgi:hypothetical protein
LHNIWAFTRGCDYDENCELYNHNCGGCKILASDKENDLSRRIHNRKEKVFDKLNRLTIIGLSLWIASCAKSSSLFMDKNILCLPNPIDTKVFAPFDALQARQLLNLPSDKN